MWLHTVSFSSVGHGTMSQTAMHPAEVSDDLSIERMLLSGRLAKARRRNDRVIYGNSMYWD